jgi:hypothetical protein
VPTTKPRYTVTETDDELLSRALRMAAERWPEHRRSDAQLLVDLVAAGMHAIERERGDAIERRRAAITATSGALSGAYGAGYLEELRRDWPE